MEYVPLSLIGYKYLYLMIVANSSANSFRTLFGMLSGPTDLFTWSNDNALYVGLVFGYKEFLW